MLQQKEAGVPVLPLSDRLHPCRMLAGHGKSDFQSIPPLSLALFCTNCAIQISHSFAFSQSACAFLARFVELSCPYERVREEYLDCSLSEYGRYNG